MSDVRATFLLSLNYEPDVFQVKALNSIDADGTMGGYDLSLIQSIASTLKIPLVAIGGAGSLADLKEARTAGASAVAAGSLFVYQKAHRAVLITYPTKGEIKKLF